MLANFCRRNASYFSINCVNIQNNYVKMRHNYVDMQKKNLQKLPDNCPHVT